MTRIPRRRTAAALAVPALTLPLLAACASSSASTAAAAHGSASGASTATATLTTIDGKKVALPGNKPVALVFISIGCADCASAASSAAQAQAVTGTKATVLGVDLDQGVAPGEVTGFLSQIGASGLPVTIDAALATKYQVAALSTVLVIDPAGRVTYQAVAPSATAIVTALTKAGA